MTLAPKNADDLLRPSIWMLQVSSTCLGICTPIYIGDPFIRHRGMGIVAIAFRVIVPLQSPGLRRGIFHLLVGTAVEILSSSASVAHFEEDVSTRRIVLGSVFWTVMAVGWACFQCQLFSTIYQILQQIHVEKEATASVLSMVCDATFWLGADGDTLLDDSPKLGAILGSGTRGQRLSQYMSAEEQARLCALFRGVPEGAPDGEQGTPVHLLSTTIAGPRMPAHEVDLFVVDRRFAFSGCAVKQPASEAQQAAFQQRGYLVGLRLGQSSSAESGHGASLPSDQLLAQEPAIHPSSSVESARPSVVPVPHAAAKGVPTSNNQPAEGRIARREGGASAGHHAASVCSTSSSSWYVAVHNSFVSVCRRGGSRGSTRRAQSAPPRCETHETEANEGQEPDEQSQCAGLPPDPLPAQWPAMPPSPSSAGGAPPSAVPVPPAAAEGVPTSNSQPAEHLIVATRPPQGDASAGRRPAASVCSTSPSSLCVAVHNTFVSVRRRGPSRRAQSAPARCGAQKVQARGGPESDEQSSCSTSSCASAGSGGRGTVIRINACEHPAAMLVEVMGLKSTDSCVHLTDVLKVRAGGWRSCGGSLHASGRCQVCVFEQNAEHPGRTPCTNGVLCARCHERHAFPNRKSRKSHNKASSRA